MNPYVILIVALLGCGSKEASTNGAALSVSLSGIRVEQRDMEWTFESKAAIDAATSKATWTITAGPGQPPRPMVVLHATVEVKSTGSKGAPVANAVVQLQAKTSTGWITHATHVVDTTKGGEARGVFAVDGDPKRVSMMELALATGTLEMVDRPGKPFPPVLGPAVLAPRESFSLGLVATFENAVMKLAPGTTIRLRVGVSHGDAGTGPDVARMIDIDGSGTIEPDEGTVATAWVTSGDLVVPELGPRPDVTIVATERDFEATGPVTFSDPVIELGSTGGKVAVTYKVDKKQPSSLTHCARLLGPGISKEACDTVSWDSTPPQD